jgi:hypothetical protein
MDWQNVPGHMRLRAYVRRYHGSFAEQDKNIR